MRPVLKALSVILSILSSMDSSEFQHKINSPENVPACEKLAVNGVTLVCPCCSTHMSVPGGLLAAAALMSESSGAQAKCRAR